MPQTPNPQPELLETLLARTGIREYDVLLVGDGSGNAWNMPCGWACFVVDRIHRGRKLLKGAADPGSVNFAESQAYLHALNWYDANVGKALLKQLGVLNVHIITDSQNVAAWGTRAMTSGMELPRKHIPIWAALREYRRVGYVCTFHWAARLTSGMNWAADLVAGLSRRYLQAAPPHDRACVQAMEALAQVQFADPASGAEFSPYAFDPDEP